MEKEQGRERKNWSFTYLLAVTLWLDHTTPTFLLTSVTPMSPRLPGSLRRRRSLTLAPMALPRFFRCVLLFWPPGEKSRRPEAVLSFVPCFSCSPALEFSNMLWSTAKRREHAAEQSGLFKGFLCAAYIRTQKLRNDAEGLKSRFHQWHADKTSNQPSKNEIKTSTRATSSGRSSASTITAPITFHNISYLRQFLWKHLRETMKVF